MTRQRISREKVKQAIPKSGGLISRIATKAGYSWTATRDFIASDEELKLLVKDEEEAIDDMAESAIIKKISEGDEQSAKWWLARRRRVKFGDSLALGNPDGTALAPVTIVEIIKTYETRPDDKPAE